MSAGIISQHTSATTPRQSRKVSTIEHGLFSVSTVLAYFSFLGFLKSLFSMPDIGTFRINAIIQPNITGFKTPIITPRSLNNLS